jgi:hypothetical protein
MGLPARVLLCCKAVLKAYNTSLRILSADLRPCHMPWKEPLPKVYGAVLWDHLRRDRLRGMTA